MGSRNARYKTHMRPLCSHFMYYCVHVCFPDLIANLYGMLFRPHNERKTCFVWMEEDTPEHRKATTTL